MSTATLKHQEEQQREEDRLPPAHSPFGTQQRDAANTDNTLEGYAAMNDVSAHSSAIAEEVWEHPVDEHAEISKLAYDYYLERGGGHGAHEDDWYRAEREFKSRRQPE
jgi:hypothetical protein